MSETTGVVREKLAGGGIGRFVERVECYRVELQPGQKTGLHLHIGGVIGYVIEGDIAFQIEGQQEKTLASGMGFFEPGEARIIRFDNLSNSRTARFVAVYPLSGADALITMLTS